MLDVHPPHKAAHSWADFFIHIATIAVGLLLAVGLEQVVESLHHRHQLNEAREQLEAEYHANLVVYRYQRLEYQRFLPLLERDLAIFQYLRLHPGAPQSQWPGEISMYHTLPRFLNATWSSLQTGDLLTRMPRAELNRYKALYDRLGGIDDAQAEADVSTYRALRYGIRNQAPETLTPAEYDEEISAITDILAEYVHMVQGERNLSMAFPEFQPAVPQSDVQAIVHVVSPAQDRAAAESKQQKLSEEIKSFNDAR